MQESTPSKDDNSSFNPRLDARPSLLKLLPQILSSLTSLWKAASVSEARSDSQTATQSWWTLGSPKVVIVLNKAEFRCYAGFLISDFMC